MDQVVPDSDILLSHPLRPIVGAQQKLDGYLDLAFCILAVHLQRDPRRQPLRVLCQTLVERDIREQPYFQLANRVDAPAQHRPPCVHQHRPQRP